MAKAYDIEGREVIAAVKGLRTQILTIGPDQCVPWHHHSEVTDTFFCIEGPMQIETRSPDEQRVLSPGETTAVGAGQPHRVSGLTMVVANFSLFRALASTILYPTTEVVAMPSPSHRWARQRR